MTIPDAITLRDLEVLSTPALHGKPLLALLDRTVSRAGHRMLRERLTALQSSPQEIVSIQQAHQTLAADANTIRGLCEMADTDRVERYLGSNWQLPRNRTAARRLADRMWRPRWFQQYLGDLRAAQTHVRSLLDATARLSAALLRTDSVLLQSLGTRINEVLHQPAVQQAAKVRGSRNAQLVKFDQSARGEAAASLKLLIELAATVEAMWSVGVASAEHGWCYPEPGGRLRVQGLRHPFLDPLTSVGNDFELDGAVRVCFFTGPNMAGKSTFLKSVAVAALLAHAGCAVPARAMEFPVFATVFSTGQPTESLHAGESLYLAEVRRIRFMAEALLASGSMLAIVDEPFRGTNLPDAREATLEVVARLVSHPNVIVLMASHLVEVVPAMEGDSRIRLFHFAADLDGPDPRFDYLLREGMSAQRLGMPLLRREGVLELFEQAASRAAVR